MTKIEQRQKEIEDQLKKGFVKNNYGNNHLRKNPPKSNKYIVRKSER